MISAQPTLFQTDIRRSAVLDRPRVYRYELWRRWSDGDRYVNFICLNPSTADENTDDPTVKKCVKFARIWGFDAVCITNLFAYRATNPRELYKVSDPGGFGNDRHIVNVARDAALVICAWGRDGALMGRGAKVRRLVRYFDPHYLRITHSQPWHPLYLRDDTKPSRWYSDNFFTSKDKEN